jgi:3-methyl-2-oxobutanoate hydroxymethyltransferase
MNSEKITPMTLREMKDKKEKITLVTVYDYSFARIVDECGIEILLVGDSLGLFVTGYRNIFPVTLEESIYHTKAVARAIKRGLVVTDMPFISFQINVDETKRNAGRIIKEGRADAVKLEGGEEVAEHIRALVGIGIPVMGHIGVLDQSILLTGQYKVKGKTEQERGKLLRDAKAVEAAGACCVGLEAIPLDLAAEITHTLRIPTIGLGAGVHCDGQSLLIHDLIGLSEGFQPKFVKKYANVRQVICDAVSQFIREVKEASFPDDAHSYH